MKTLIIFVFATLAVLNCDGSASNLQRYHHHHLRMRRDLVTFKDELKEWASKLSIDEILERGKLKLKEIVDLQIREILGNNEAILQLYDQIKVNASRITEDVGSMVDAGREMAYDVLLSEDDDGESASQNVTECTRLARSSLGAGEAAIKNATSCIVDTIERAEKSIDEIRNTTMTMVEDALEIYEHLAHKCWPAGDKPEPSKFAIAECVVKVAKRGIDNFSKTIPRLIGLGLEVASQVMTLRERLPICMIDRAAGAMINQARSLAKGTRKCIRQEILTRRDDNDKELAGKRMMDAKDRKQEKLGVKVENGLFGRLKGFFKG